MAVIAVYSVSLLVVILVLCCNDVFGQVVVGQLPNEQHGIGGTLELLSTTQIKIKSFSYDGTGPAAFLYYFSPGAAVSSGSGIKISYPNGRSNGAFRVGVRFSNEDITFSMPSGSDVCDIGTFTIWCEAARSFFTRLAFPRSTFANSGADPCTLAPSSSVTMAAPTIRPATTMGSHATGMVTVPSGTQMQATDRPPENTFSIVVGTLPTEAHQVSGILTFLSTTRIRIVRFNYDGTAPATYLYYYLPGVTATPTAGGFKIPLATDNGGDSRGAFKRGTQIADQDLTVDLPAGMDVCDIGTFTVWCETARVFFSTLVVSRDVFENSGNDPCTLKASTATVAPSSSSYENCEIFSPALHLRWTVDNEGQRIKFKLSGCQSNNIQVPQYMGFGVSGSTTATNMDRADVTITWVDNNGQPNAVDYFLRSRTQCRSGLGVCPDEMDSRGTCTNNVEEVSGKNINREQTVSFTRPITTSDTDCDKPFNVNSDQFIVWAIGGVEQTAFRHNFRSDATTPAVRFNRTARDNCGTTAITCSSCDPFPAVRIDAQSGSTFFRAAIGPSGNDRGYTAITKQAGWGIAWFINDSLIPEIVVKRGRTYTFQVEGGNNPMDAANYHPFYITDSSIGGRLLNSESEKRGEKVFAGMTSGDMPTAVGRLCASVENDTSFRILERCGSFNEFKVSLTKTCRPGQPGRLTWTPDDNTPDIVYYQCATHRNLGWKIYVMGRTRSIAISSSPIARLTGVVILAYFMI